MTLLGYGVASLFRKLVHCSFPLLSLPSSFLFATLVTVSWTGFFESVGGVFVRVAVALPSADPQSWVETGVRGRWWHIDAPMILIKWLDFEVLDKRDVSSVTVSCYSST